MDADVVSRDVWCERIESLEGVSAGGGGAAPSDSNFPAAVGVDTACRLVDGTL